MKCPYINDLIAIIFMVAVIIVSNITESGDSRALKVVAIICFITAIVLWILPLIAFRRYGEVPKGKKYFEAATIVTKGIYSVVRHPQYLSYMLLAAGFACLRQSLIIVLCAFLAILFFYLQAKQEEQQLLRVFGEEYRSYMKRVPGFIPYKFTSSK